MEENFEEPIFREFSHYSSKAEGNIIKAENAEIYGRTKISVDEDSHDGVKVILKKDANDSIQEIKFVCSCGQTKSIILDYSEQ